MTVLNRRASLVVMAAGVLSANARAQGKPTRVVVFSSGGPVDFVARLLASKLTPIVPGPVLVEPRPGANGMVAAQNVISSEADGSSLLLTSSGLLTISPVLNKMSFDPDRDLVPVSRVVVNASAVAVNASLPVSNMKEFVAYAKSRKEPLAFASPGVGNITHLWIEQLKDATGLNLLHVPYKGISPAMTDILGGRVAGTIADWPALQGYVSSGKMKVLGLVGANRSSAISSIPTLKEQGFPGVEGLSWYGVFVSSALPRAKVDELSHSIAHALADPELQHRLREAGAEPAPTTPRELAQIVQTDRARWAQLIRSKGITAE